MSRTPCDEDRRATGLSRHRTRSHTSMKGVGAGNGNSRKSRAIAACTWPQTSKPPAPEIRCLAVSPRPRERRREWRQWQSSQPDLRDKAVTAGAEPRGLRGADPSLAGAKPQTSKQNARRGFASLKRLGSDTTSHAPDRQPYPIHIRDGTCAPVLLLFLRTSLTDV